MFPGSRFEYNHILFLTEAPRNLLTVAYSKSTVYATAEREVQEVALMKLMDANASESLAIWKLEERQGSLMPVLETTLYINTQLPEARLQELIWRNCGNLDTLYKASVAAVSPLPILDTPDVSKKVKNFLVSKGFRKIKESTTPYSTSFLVVMSSDNEPEESKWKRFPLKIDVTGILAFRIYFSLEDAAVTAKGHFSSSAKYLIAKINQRFAVGYYNYASGSNQIQYTIKLHYKTLAPADITASIKAYYDACVLYYQWTAPALAAMHGDMLETLQSLSESAISDYQGQINEELQEKTRWKVIGSQKIGPGQGNVDTRLLDLLSRSEALAPYLLEKPIYQLIKREGERNSVRVRTSVLLTPLRTYISSPNPALDWVVKQLLTLYNTLLPLQVFPTLAMLHCQVTPAPRLFIVPGVDLHSDEAKCIREVMSVLYACRWNLRQRSTASDGIHLKWDGFELPARTGLPGVDLQKIRRKAEEYLLYRIQGSPRAEKFTRRYQLYTSVQKSLGMNKNPLQGWTEDFSPRKQDGKEEVSKWYLCERHDYPIWLGELGKAIIPVLLQVAAALGALHDNKFCHWFLSLITIRPAWRDLRPEEGRQSAVEDPDIALVLPCITPYFSSFLFPVIPESCHKFIAPEVMRYIKEGISVGDIYAADVFSLCQVIYEKLQNSLESREELRALREVVTRGKEEKPELRPGLREVLARVKELSE